MEGISYTTKSIVVIGAVDVINDIASDEGYVTYCNKSTSVGDGIIRQSDLLPKKQTVKSFLSSCFALFY
jgi:hypothetical protein